MLADRPILVATERVLWTQTVPSECSRTMALLVELRLERDRSNRHQW
jgi:hypothetical protein